jgi:NAD(P)-dependent dehydrogenase (short-subunit alcohol dehydrogenase family)
MSKVWLITGASRCLGRAFTEAILEAGDRVVATARSPEQLVEPQGRYSGNIRTVALDVTNEAQAKAAFEAAIASFGVLDVLVNNAGYGYVCPVEHTPLTDFRAQIETNLFGVIIMTKAVLPYFRGRRAGHIIQEPRSQDASDRQGAHPTRPRSSELRASLSRWSKRSDRSASKSRSWNLAALHRFCRALHPTERRPARVRLHCRCGAGVTLQEALKAADQLKAQGTAVRVIDLYCVKPIDGKELAREIAATGGRLITVEDHWAEGGIGEAVLSALAQAGVASAKSQLLAVREMPHSGGPDELVDAFGISARHIVEAVRRIS